MVKAKKGAVPFILTQPRIKLIRLTNEENHKPLAEVPSVQLLRLLSGKPHRTPHGILRGRRLHRQHMASRKELSGMGEHHARRHPEHSHRRSLRMGGDPQAADQRLYRTAEREIQESHSHDRTRTDHQGQGGQTGAQPGIHQSRNHQREG